MSWEFERVAGPYGFTEGPVWDGDGIVFSDMPNDTIWRYDCRTGECTDYKSDTSGANGLKFDSHGRLYACEMVGRQVTQYHEGTRTPIATHYEGNRLNSPNDLAIDADDRIWFTDPFYDTGWEPDDKTLELGHRSVYRVDPDRGVESIERMTTDTTNPNGILLSPSEERLYVAQSDYDGDFELRAYPIGAGSIGDYEVLHDFAPHRGIDGMCLDEDGNIVATCGHEEGGKGPRIEVFAPDGEILATHPSPDPLPTNCCFGDDDLKSLFLTGSDGSLYRARTDLRGYLGPP